MNFIDTHVSICYSFTDRGVNKKEREIIMPIQLYDKDEILNSCLKIFAHHGYEKTSTSMLAQAAGISRTLIFHHFKNKKELYLEILDHCMKKAMDEMDARSLADESDFFEAREKFSHLKFNFGKNNPEVYMIVKDILYHIPEELKAEFLEKYGDLQKKITLFWEKLFEKVPLKEGLDRKQAFDLVQLTLEYFDNKYFTESIDGNLIDDEYYKQFIIERNKYLDMIRYGIQA